MTDGIYDAIHRALTGEYTDSDGNDQTEDSITDLKTAYTDISDEIKTAVPTTNASCKSK